MNNYSEIDCDFYLKNKSFDGVSDYVDTGLNLFDTDSDWCIYINFTDLGVTDGDISIIHNMEEIQPYTGVSLAKWASPWLNFSGQGFIFWSFINLNATPDVKIVLFRRGSRIGYKTINSNIVERNYGFPKIINYNLLIGCYQSASGVKGRHWKGIVNELMVYKNKTVTDEEINSLLERGE